MRSSIRVVKTKQTFQARKFVKFPKNQLKLDQFFRLLDQLSARIRPLDQLFGS